MATETGQSTAGMPQSRVNESRVETAGISAPDKPAADPISYEAIIGHLNLRTGKHFTVNNKETRAKIKARFAEGASLQDFIRVIDNMTARVFESHPLRHIIYIISISYNSITDWQCLGR